MDTEDYNVMCKAIENGGLCKSMDYRNWKRKVLNEVRKGQGGMSAGSFSLMKGHRSSSGLGKD